MLGDAVYYSHLNIAFYAILSACFTSKLSMLFHNIRAFNSVNDSDNK